MNIGAISLNKALEVFSNKDSKGSFVPFDMTYRTFNDQTKKGGKLKYFESVTYLPSPKDYKKKDSNHDKIKPPKHFENRTRNIQFSDGTVKSIRIDFIISINGTKVIY